MKTEKALYRQGDVLIQWFAKELPKEVKKLSPDGSRTILAYGEVTGHAHALSAKTSTLYEWNGNRLMEITKPTDLVHEEHSSITFAPGIYRIIQQREYTPKGVRNVAD